MALSFSDYIGIKSDFLYELGVFDTILDIDSRFFINFQRVKEAKTSEFVISYEKIQRLFRQIGKLLLASKMINDRFYNEAYRRLNMSELEEICLGYSKQSTSGSGSGHKLKTLILSTGKEILEAGIIEPEIFELVGLFEESIGPDRLSDAIGRIIEEDIILFNQRVTAECAKQVNLQNFPQANGILINPFSQKAIYLLPFELLHELPIAEEWEDIDHVCTLNREVRDRINSVIGDEWKNLTIQDKKDALKRVLLEDTDLFRALISNYKSFSLNEYDFKSDPLGESIWYPIAKDVARQFPINLSRHDIGSQDDLKTIVREICHHFKELVENNGLNKVFYTDEGKPRKEWVIQRTFQAIADSFCKANSLDMSPEVNSGRGPVDFKFSIGGFKVLVEVKLTTNPQLVHGYEKQLVEYEKSERTDDSFYLVIDNGVSEKRIDSLYAIHNEFIRKRIKIHELIVINSTILPSASRI